MPTRLIPALFVLVLLVATSATTSLAVLRHWHEIPSILPKALLLLNAVILASAIAFFLDGSIKRRPDGWVAPMICLGAFALASLLALPFLTKRDLHSLDLYSAHSAQLPLAILCAGFLANRTCRRSFGQSPVDRPPEVGWRFGAVAGIVALGTPLICAYAPYLGRHFTPLGLAFAPPVIAIVLAMTSWAVLRRVSLLRE